MNVSGLREFLLSLGGPLAALGVAPRTAADLRAAADALAPFAGLELSQFADFLRRADEFRASGAVTTVGELSAVAASANALADAADAVASGGDDERRVGESRKALEAAVGALAGRFGATVKFTTAKTWLPNLRLAGGGRAAAAQLRSLAARVTSPDAYRDPALVADIEHVAKLGDGALKAAAGELGVTGSGKGAKFVESLLARLTGVSPPAPARKGRATKAAAPADPDRVPKAVERVKQLAERASDPAAVSDAEIEALLAELKSGFSAAELKAVAKGAVGVTARGGADALLEIQATLTASRRLLEGQRV